MTSNMEDDDLDLLNEGTAGAASQSVRKTINLKLRPESKGRGRGRKATKNVKKIKQESPPTDDEEEMEEERERERERDRERERERERESALLNHENIQLSPVKDREPWTPIQTISWNNKVNLIGEKVVDPMIHSCDTCTLPILIYGRMIPCKHVFCFNCAKKTEKNCPRCEESVQRIEQSALGTVYICSFGGSRHTPKGCKRTYLSARDLQAHIGHRHLKAVEAKAKKAGSGQIPGAATSASLTASTGNPFKITIPDLGTQTKISIGVSAAAHSQPVQSKAPLQQPQVSMARPEQTYQTPTQEVYVHHAPPPQPQMVPHPQPVPPPASLSHSQPPPDSFRGSSIPVLSSRTNLISIPIQGVQHQQHQEYKPQQMQYPQVSFPQSRPPGPAQIPVSQPFPSHSHAPPMRQAPPQSFHAPMSHAGNPISYATAPMSMPGPIMVPSQMPPRPSAVVLSSGPGGPPMHPPPMNVPPPHIGPPPGHPQGMPPPQRYPSPHRQYEETPMSPSYNQPGGHSPRPPWPGSGPPRGPPGGPPGPVPPRPNVSAPPPLRPPDNFQYFH